MRWSAKQYAAVFAVVIVIAAVAVYAYTQMGSGDDSGDDSEVRYLYNYKYEEKDSITLYDGKTVTAEEKGVDKLLVYTVVFQNKYTNYTGINLYPASTSASASKTNLVQLTTTITNPSSGADRALYPEDGIINYFSSTRSITVHAGAEMTFQVAFAHKDYSSHATEKSKITTALTFNNTDIMKYGEESGKISIPDGAVLQFKTNPALTSPTYTESASIELANGSTATADAGYCYRVYSIGMRSAGEACTINPADVHLILSYKDAKTTVTAGHTFDAVTDFIDTAPVSLDAWSGDDSTACKTMKVAFLVPKKNSSVATDISNTAYLMFDGHAAGYITSNSHIVID